MEENKAEIHHGRWKQVLSSPRFLADQLLVAGGIVLYLLLSNLPAFADVIRKLYAAVSPFVVAFVIAWLLAPIVHFLQEKLFRRGKPGLRRSLAILITYLVVIAALAAVLWIILPQVYESLMLLVDKTPDYLTNLQKAADKLAKRFSLADSIKAEFLVEDYSSLLTKISTWLSARLPQLVTAGVNVGNGLISAFTALIASIYILASTDRLKKITSRIIHALLPTPQDKKMIGFLRRSNGIFTGFIDGKLLDSLIIGLLCLVGCLLLRIPFAGLVSLVVGITNIIPVFGPIIGAIPCLVILLIVDPWSALWFLIFVVALQQLDGNVIGPRILGDSTGVSPLGVLLSITVGGKLAGITGMLIGVPLYAIFSFTVKEFIDLKLAQKAEAAAKKSSENAEPFVDNTNSL